MHGADDLVARTAINENMVSTAGLNYHRLGESMANLHSSSPLSKTRRCALWLLISRSTGLPLTGEMKIVTLIPIKTPTTAGRRLANL